ncbi:MAG TPA: FAD-dependent oxidoreductase [Thermomicrobiales bacterium]|nr:FAD-dependent oxidoreductase [Thermomicrobiales bacterium]
MGDDVKTSKAKGETALTPAPSPAHRERGATVPSPIIHHLSPMAEVVIIGSGIFGAAIGYHLAEAGLNVVIVERGAFCGEASGANVGLVTVSAKPIGVLFDLAWMGQRRYETLSERLGRDIHFRQPGTMNLTSTPEDLAERRQLTEAQRERGLDVRHISGDEARELEPWIPDSILGGSFCPTDGGVYPFAVVKAYLAKAQELGVKLFVGAEVTGVSVENGRATGVETTRGPIRAKWVVNAAGAWAERISAMVGLRTPMTPVRGQLLVTLPLPPLMNRVVFGVEPSVRQMYSGNSIVGSVTQRAGFDKRLTPQTIRALARGIVELHPALASAPVIRGWAGLRPGTPDEMPILGVSRRVPGFVIATGGFRNGILYGPAAGQLIADDILGRPLEIDIDPLRPERFEEIDVRD